MSSIKMSAKEFLATEFPDSEIPIPIDPKTTKSKNPDTLNQTISISVLPKMTGMPQVGGMPQDCDTKHNK
jgi:hypothetical protein